MVAVRADFVLRVVAAMAATLSYGWDPDIDLGTDGDWFVDAVNGDDGNAGTSVGAAFQTLTAAFTAASAGDRIRARDGDYRVEMDPKSGTLSINPTEVLGYGTEKPRITGADILTGMVAADVGDATRVGASWGSMYVKRNLAKSAIASSDPKCLNIFEAGTKLHLCVDWVGGSLNDLFFQQDVGAWHTATTVHVDGSNRIEGYTLASVTDDYSEAQIENAIIYGHKTANSLFISTIADFDTGTDKITITDAATHTVAAGSDPAWNKFALLNILPAMAQGQWGWWDNGDGTVDVYVWPNDSGNITAGIEYSARVHCIDLTSKNFITIKGFDCRQSAGWNVAWDGFAIVSRDLAQKDGITLEHCRMYGTFSAQCGGLRLVLTDNVRIRNCTSELHQNGFGFVLTAQYTNGDPPTRTPSVGLDFQDNLARRCEDSPFRIYTQEDAVFAFCMAEDCATSVHSNKINFYEGCDQILVWGLRFDGCGGYVTFQRSSGLAFCFIEANSDINDSTSVSCRTFVDQNDLSTDQPPNLHNGSTFDCYLLNCTFLPDTVGIAGGSENGMDVTSQHAAYDGVTWTVRNNLYFGHVVQRPAQIDVFSGNWNAATDGAYDGNNSADAATDIWTDPAAGDFTIKTGAPIRSATGDDLTADIATLQAQFGTTRFTRWNLDSRGRPFTAATPPVGAVADYDYAA